VSDVRLGVNNCFAVKRWVEPERWFAIVKEELGLDVVQVSLDVVDFDIGPRHFAVVARRIRRLAEEYGVRLHSVFGGLISYSYNGLMNPNIAYRNARLEWFTEAIWKAAELGVDSFGGPLGALTEKDFLDAKRREYLKEVLIEQLIYLTEVAAAAGLKSLLWEPTPLRRELSHTTAECVELYQRVNEHAAVPFRFCLDVGHQCAYDVTGDESDPYYHLEKLLPMTEVVHLQQTDGKYDRHWPFTPEYNEKGIIAKERILESVAKRANGPVYLVLEIVHPFEESDEKVLRDMKASADYWK